MLYQSFGNGGKRLPGNFLFQRRSCFRHELPGRVALNYGSGTKAVTMTVRGELHQLYLVFVAFAAASRPPAVRRPALRLC